MTVAVLGAGVGHVVLWTLSELHALFAGHRGIGRGDLKLAANDWQLGGCGEVVFALLLAFVGGSFGILPGLLTGHRKHQERVPFGPAMAFSGVVVLLAGPTVRAGMLQG